MAILQTQCTCGIKVEIRSGQDVICSMRSDRLQAVYPDDETKHYCIYRCKKCLQPLHTTVKEYEYIPYVEKYTDVKEKKRIR